MGAGGAWGEATTGGAQSCWAKTTGHPPENAVQRRLEGAGLGKGGGAEGNAGRRHARRNGRRSSGGPAWARRRPSGAGGRRPCWQAKQGVRPVMGGRPGPVDHAKLSNDAKVAFARPHQAALGRGSHPGWRPDGTRGHFGLCRPATGGAPRDLVVSKAYCPHLRMGPAGLGQAGCTGDWGCSRWGQGKR